MQVGFLQKLLPCEHCKPGHDGSVSGIKGRVGLRPTIYQHRTVLPYAGAVKVHRIDALRHTDVGKAVTTFVV